MKKHSAFPLLCAAAAALLSSCAVVPMQDAGSDARAKEFGRPPPGLSGLYLYRRDTIGGMVKRGLYVDGHYIGQNGHRTYFYRFVTPGEHWLQTDSEIGRKQILLNAEDGENYFFRQGMEAGTFISGTVLSGVAPDDGKRDVRRLRLAADLDDPAKNLANASQADGAGSLPALKALPRRKGADDGPDRADAGGEWNVSLWDAPEGEDAGE